MTVEQQRFQGVEIVDALAAFSDAPAILTSYGPPPERRVLAANDLAVQAIFGGRQPVGRPLAELLPGLEGQQVLELIDDVWASRRPVSHAGMRIHVDPSDPDSLGYFDFTLSPVLGPDGVPTHLVSVSTDATKRIEAQARAAADDAAAADLRVAQARDVTLLLQRALLPASMPVLPEIALAGRYLVAADDQAAGGDWLDVITLPDGRLALVTGDVVGHGAEASVTMGQLRTVLLVHFRRSVDLAEAVDLLEAHAETLPRARSATAAIAILDPTDGAMEYVTCGHPAPLVADDEGTTRFLPASGGRPLGGNYGPVEVSRDALREGELLLLYTDGLIEAPTRTVATGMEELAQSARFATTRVPGTDEVEAPREELFCHDVLETMGRVHGYGDDVTALVARRRPVPIEPLHRVLGTDIDALDDGRDAFEAWLSPLAVNGQDRVALTVALVEVLTNVIEHAGATEAQLSVRLDAGGRAVVSVTDDGVWNPGHGEGIGLSTVRRLTDTAVVSIAAPTTVEFSRRLARPLDQRVTSFGPKVPVPAPFTAERLTDSDPVVLRVSGDVDVRTAPKLASALNRLTLGSTRSAHVDLSAVTMLTSAGVRALQPHLDGPPAISVEAPDGSPARAVLAVIGYEPAA